MEKNNMTAVEWLIERIESTSHDLHHLMKVRGEFEQAKQMEKEQIMNAFGVGCQVESTRLIGYHGMAEQYYNETYGTTDGITTVNRMGGIIKTQHSTMH